MVPLMEVQEDGGSLQDKSPWIGKQLGGVRNGSWDRELPHEPTLLMDSCDRQHQDTCMLLSTQPIKRRR